MKRLKSKQEDFTEDDLPQKRTQVFAYCYREHFSLLFMLGCLCLLLLLPVLIVTVMSDSYVINAVAALEEITAENIARVRYTAETMSGLIQIGTFTLFFTLLTGVIQVLRQMIWNEPVFFGDDYKTGLKSNALVFSLVAILLSGLYYFLNVITNTVLLYVSYALFYVLILPISLWVVTQSVYYKLGTFDIIKNAVIFYIKTFPVTLLAVFLTVAPFWLIDNLIPLGLIYIKYLIFVVLAIFYIVPLIIGWLLYACRIFDKSINKEHYPQAYRKGMKSVIEEEKDENESQKMRGLY